MLDSTCHFYPCGLTYSHVRLFSLPGLAIQFCINLYYVKTHKKYSFSDLQQGFIVLAAFIITSVLGPTVWHLWIYARSANANFYFGVGLAFAIAQVRWPRLLLLLYFKIVFYLYSQVVF